MEPQPMLPELSSVNSTLGLTPVCTTSGTLARSVDAACAAHGCSASASAASVAVQRLRADGGVAVGCCMRDSLSHASAEGKLDHGLHRAARVPRPLHAHRHP